MVQKAMPFSVWSIRGRADASRPQMVPARLVSQNALIVRLFRAFSLFNGVDCLAQRAVIDEGSMSVEGTSPTIYIGHRQYHRPSCPSLRRIRPVTMISKRTHQYTFAEVADVVEGLLMF